MALLDHYGVPITGKNVAVIGRSCVVGLPTQLLFMDRGATVTNCDINTTDLRSIVRSSDIVVASAGSPELVKADWVKSGAVVVDVGFHVKEEWCEKKGKISERIVGDVHPDVHNVASLMTPVPRGVGPMTVAMLLENTLEAFHHQQKKAWSHRV
jgi:5,10-methylene-tetrahydrofolate dehydrogenase/methenyl tetrahydrofolate cyclohydrolase